MIKVVILILIIFIILYLIKRFRESFNSNDITYLNTNNVCNMLAHPSWVIKVGRREGGLAALTDLIWENCFLCASAVPQPCHLPRKCIDLKIKYICF